MNEKETKRKNVFTEQDKRTLEELSKRMEKTEQSIKGVGTKASIETTATFVPAGEGRLRFGQKQFWKK